jgi:hypothetical protein
MASTGSRGISPLTGIKRVVASCAAAGVVLAGCAVSTQVTLTKRSGLEQQLLVRALERAVAQLDPPRFAGNRVALELFALTQDRAFAEAFMAAQLERHGARVVPEGQAADLRLRVFSSVWGVDHAETLVGIPAFRTPGVDVGVPEVALFKSTRNRGYSEVQVYAFDGRTGEFVAGQSPVGLGRAKYNRYTVLILIRFTLTDIEQRTE